MVLNNFIYITDLHYSETSPRAWSVDYGATLLSWLEEVFRKASELNCPIIHGGDLGHRSNWDCNMLTNFLNLRKKYEKVPFYTVVGNHDIIGRNIHSLYDGTGLGLLAKLDSNIVEIINPKLGVNSEDQLVFDNVVFWGFHSDWEETHNVINGKSFDLDSEKMNIAVIHAPVGGSPSPFWIDVRATKLEGFKIALFGDIHPGWKTFKDGDNCVKINPGSFGRRTIEDVNRKSTALIFDISGKDIFVEEFIPSNQDNSKIFNLTLKVSGEIRKEFLKAIEKVKALKVEDPLQIILEKAKILGVKEEAVVKLFKHIKK